MVFSSDNYIVAIILLVMILLAVIGYFAERANEKKNEGIKKESNQDLIDLSNKRLSDFQDQKEESKEEVKEEKEEVISSNTEELKNVNLVANTVVNQNVGTVGNTINYTANTNSATDGNIIEKSIATETNATLVNTISSEKLEKIDELDKELDILLPKEKLLNEDLLSDIDFMELDKTQKIDLSGVPDLDNIDLPKIMQMDEEEDIWKF